MGGDCKAGVAAILEALESITEDNMSHRSIEVAFTREEELGLIGAHNLNFTMLKSDTAIVFDGEGPSSQITSASPTNFSFDIEIIGRSAHAGVEPEKGISAIKISADLISKLPQGRLDEETTFNVGKIEGGSTRNTVAEKVSIQGEFRSRSTETVDNLKLQINETIKEILKIILMQSSTMNFKLNFRHTPLLMKTNLQTWANLRLYQWDLSQKCSPQEAEPTAMYSD
ncbi:MAG: hypothetical protein CM1200mP38_3740 [Dehalococcoidia bacterium]|nr:MAG: hypothetical protein CM1200mP38_3740 [Dehalococcoidia bacterium]